MKLKIPYLCCIFMLSTHWVYAEEITQAAGQSTPKQENAPMQGNTPVQPNAPSPNTSDTMIDCTTLTKEEQLFANKLTRMNRLMFCNKFSRGQRQTAMDLAKQKDNTGARMMTEDQAVMRVAKDNNMMTPSSSNKTRSGCSAQ